MSIESEIFKRMKFDSTKLLNYGFIKEQNVYKYSKEFLQNSFRADIVIYDNKTLKGKIYDLESNDEYISFRVESQMGEFVNKVRDEYKNILKDIAQNCCIKEPFLFEQSNRISQWIKEKYNDEPEFAWVKFPGYGIFRNLTNKKWYALIMNIDKSKLENASGEIEIINLKLDEKKIPILLKRQGFYPSYHMKKENWISIILNDTLSDEEIKNYIVESHQFTEQTREWIVPANPKYYDIIHCFDKTDTIFWKQSSNIEVGDKIYIYVTEPYSAILYQCEAMEVNIPYEYKDVNLSMKKVMKVKLIKKYNQEDYSFNKLKEYGVNAIRGPRLITKELQKELNKG